MLYQIATAALAFSTNSAVLSSKARMPAASMVVGAPNSVGGMFTLSDDLHKQVTFIDSGLAAENDQFVSTGVVGKVVPTSTAAAAPASAAPITESEVLAAQKLWAESIALISKVYADEGDFVGTAGECAGKLYGYGKSNVLFKPTKATKNPFRPDADSAMSYFVGSKAMNNPKFDGEDAGFAINGGRGWKSVTFRNHQIELLGESATAMGDYIFVDATSGDEVRVEYTFGYKRNDDGKVRIYLHHSSVPYAA